MAELDRRAIKALASDTRVAILKSLGARRKMPSELAKERALAASTVVEHLKVLENSGLVRRVETGHKWTYYELTRKGQELAAPRLPMQHVIVLGLGLLLVFGSLNFLLQAVYFPLSPTPTTSNRESAATGVPLLSETMKAPPELPLPVTPPNIVDPQVSILLLGVVLSLYGGWRIWKSS